MLRETSFDKNSPKSINPAQASRSETKFPYMSSSSRYIALNALGRPKELDELVSHVEVFFVVSRKESRILLEIEGNIDATLSGQTRIKKFLARIYFEQFRRGAQI